MRKITIKQLKVLLNGTESDYLDFKETYTGKLTEYVKDILSLANSQTKEKHRFLIFGVTDKTKEIVGIESSKYRKKQSEFVTLLREQAKINKMPKFELYTLDVSGNKIDILDIENTSEQPYFLREDFQLCGEKLSAGTFYMRVCDSNRTIVDDSVFDAIYRQRFGIDKTPLEKAHIYLKNKGGWKYAYNEKNRLYFYYTQHPEFTIQDAGIEEPERFYDPWATQFLDKNASKKILFLKYHGTILEQFIWVLSDGARYLTISPESFFYEDTKTNINYWAFYYIKGSIQSLLHDMIQKVYVENSVSKGTLVYQIVFPSFSSQRNAEKMFKRNWEKYPYFRVEVGAYRSVNFHKMIKTTKVM